MTTLTPNKTIVALDKVAYVEPLFWRDLHNTYTRLSEPSFPTLHGERIDVTITCPPTETYPEETLGERLTRRGYMLDIWIPQLRVIMCNGRTLEFTGKRALDLDKIWKNRQLGKKKHNANKTTTNNKRQPELWG